MAVERIDYSSDEEYENAIQLEQIAEYKKQAYEEYENQCYEDERKRQEYDEWANS